MKSTLTALALVLAPAAAATLHAAPANAQAAQPAQRQLNLSKGALKPIVELQAAVKANDAANYQTRLSAAQAAATTPEDRLAVAQLQLQYAAARNDQAGIAAALEAMLATGAADAGQQLTIYKRLADIRYEAKQYDQAAAALERVLAAEPNNVDALITLAESRSAQGRAADAVATLQRAIQARTAAGGKADEAWYRRLVAFAHKGNLPNTLELARQWVAAYPSPASWRDAINIYRNQSKPDEATTFDVLRLARATGAFDPAQDTYAYAALAIDNWAAADAQRAVDEAIAAGKFDRNNANNKALLGALPSAKGRSAAEIAASAKEVAAAPTGRNAMRVGDAFYGVGDYTRAVELYRLALSKGSVDANTVNLRIGAALARAGDKAGATAALGKVTGRQAELAKLWQLYASTRG